MKYYKLTKEEKQIEKDLIAGKYVPVPNMEQEIDRFQKIAQAQLKNKTVNFRIAGSELEIFKSKSGKVGLPYQSLLSLLISQYNRDKFSIKL
ncbi:MAG: Toxin-antitoxin system, antitoxin component, ribbon-helix-helix domain protein [Candidatus Collierbacteria bacterium GW2011_GWB1_45_35]|uniref:Toxin-antitoxin system, antitoxin component, ribbon-helix-helix domain protein n=2 Tax=Candidatus Collieribacteriota TaxID=1752725 RepID=A0A837IJC0_9BACT|nr:MAG: Toxin-antitoxin system, antitoxin component, ribbon-helix-helix domain protein [Microgenomates group bacterium GW2011_GWC1_44_23]KKT96145.1 MAG: Toxin-antitoxin system, antitoxin component, ribbon-helix-helix domain protein [Candidatus Collierbacteria bacterium GW2011_GWA1_45_15]KKU01185.1 MAG: Toxin-antitoxin system, antitoxin component, ribbon-helix-helix domain protein [Candidatus Collierbacteria bacterium GW2011_GWB2_45_17]KKU05387.1 MAG: Toxin-antitoxin system, antitoxin component, 